MLYAVDIMPTLKCNLRCTGCDRGMGKGPVTDIADLEDFDVVQMLLQDVRKHPDFHCVFSGGEPTLYPRLAELKTFVKNKVPTIGTVLVTNGLTLLTLPIELTSAFTVIDVSVYPNTRAYIEKNYALYKMLNNIHFFYFPFFHDLNNVSTEIKPDERRTRPCVKATVVGNIKRVFPCCRAFIFERRTGNCYSVAAESYSWEALEKIAFESDMCTHCPRLYEAKKIELEGKDETRTD